MAATGDAKHDGDYANAEVVEPPAGYARHHEAVRCGVAHEAGTNHRGGGVAMFEAWR